MSSILLSPPTTLTINYHANTRYTVANKERLDSACSDLFKDLRELGPLIAKGHFGPSHYKNPAVTQETVEKKPIFSWSKGNYSPAEKKTYAFVVGINLDERQPRVYYRMAEEVSPPSSDLLHMLLSAVNPKYKLTKDERVYAISFKSFQERSALYHPVEAKIDHLDNLLYQKPINNNLDRLRNSYLEELSKIPLEDKQKLKEAIQPCYALRCLELNGLGVEKAIQGASQLLSEICREISNYTRDGKYRGFALVDAWDGIGTFRK